MSSLEPNKNTSMSSSALDSFTPLREEPDGLDAFWGRTLDALAETGPAPIAHRQPAPGVGLQFDRLEFTSLGNVTIAGYLLTHDDSESRPLIVHSHGYNSQYDVMLYWARAGCHVMGIDFRGFGRSEQVPLARGGYVLTGGDSQQRSILRGAVADLIQAQQVAKLLLSWRISSQTLYGFSFGGAIAIMAAAVGDEPDLLVAGQPTFGWNRERLRLASAGSAAEINAYCGAFPQQRSTLLETLDHFDTMHYAARLTGPTLIGVGLDDRVVPSRSVFAIGNHVASPQFEIRILPVAHSDDPRESLWATFDDEWIRLTTDGLPADFGGPERRIRGIGTEY